jgi:hypothetical protein
MEIQNKVLLVEKVGENEHIYSVPPSAGLGEIYDVICKFQGYILQKMNDSQKKPEEAVPEAAPEVQPEV